MSAATPGSLGVVKVRNLELQANHGASADERRSTRRFQVDAELTFAMGRAVESDRLSETVNYYEVCELLLKVGTERTHHLLESLAGDMLAELRRRWPHAQVQIEVRKLHPPCPGNPDYTAILLRSN